MFALGEAWHLACVPDFVRSVLMEVPPSHPLLLRELINELHEEFRIQLRFLEALAKEAARFFGVAINPRAAAGGGGPIFDDEFFAASGDDQIVVEDGESIADEDVEQVAVEDNDAIVIEDDQPEVGTETNPIVIVDDE